MDKYLLEILKDVNTIIIPGLGALTITNSNKGEIMFMSYLKHDDGKLTSYISEKEGMDENEAKNLVAKYVREIHLELDKGESYDMYQFGSFYKNDGEVDFKSWAAMHPSEESTPPTLIVEESKEEDNILTPPTPNEEKKTEEVKEEVKTEKKQPESTISIKKPTEEVKPKIENTYTPPKTEKKELNILEKEEKKATAAKLDQLKQEQDDHKKKKKRGAGFYMLVVLILLLLVGGTFLGVNYDNYKQHIPFLADKKEQNDLSETSQLEQMEELLKGDANENDEEVIEEEEILEEATEDLLEEDMTQEKETAKEEVIEKVVNTQNSDQDLPFHIIAGAFTSESNADRLGEKMRAAGYQVKIGKGRGMNLVSIKSFASRAEAQSDLSSLKDVAPNGWVYEWK
ncbi:MAG: SPOR domain-containing protein [Crocinitomicaceae bacterium]|nr:SPOR domain-containing protein [Crocinitomicaceae bacterium]